MPEIAKNYAADVPVSPWKTRGRVDNIPIPSQEILDYALRLETLDLKGLALHLVTTMVVADTIISAIEQRNQEVTSDKRLNVDRDITLETMIAYHAPRPLADAGQRGEATEFVNEYMRTHEDHELAAFVAIQNHLPLSVVSSIEQIQKPRGYPKKTIGPENPQRPGIIDWNVAITQFSTWLVAGTIIPLDRRFEEMIARHVGNPESPKRYSAEEYLDLRNWGRERIRELCEYLGIEYPNFNNWLKSKIHSGYSPEKAKQESDDLIRELFHREPEADEFLPISPAYKHLARSILSIEPSRIPDRQRGFIEKMLADPERYLRLCQKFGLVRKDASNYKSIEKNV